MNEILKLGALELSEKIQGGEVSVREAAQACLDRIREKDPELGAFISVDEEGALKRADEVQEMISKGELTSPLAGVPVAIKDNMCIKGKETTCASHILEGFYPTYTAQAVQNLEKAGCVVLGKANMDEFAMGSTTETSYYKLTRNPWNTDKVPGGSSGGSAAAVASGEAFFALGSDTGGSIRQPASFCGIVGAKPTYGTVSRYGLIAYGSSLDQIGPLAKNVPDAAAIMEAISSYDKKDSTSVDRKDTQFSRCLDTDIKGLRVGIPNDYFSEGLSEEVAERIREVGKVFESLGASVTYFDLPIVKYSLPAYYVIACAEASSNLSRFDGVKYGYRSDSYEGLHDMYKKTRTEGFGDVVKNRIMLGSYVLSSGYYDAYYLRALRVKALIKKGFDEAFEKYDVILGPTSPSTALTVGESLKDKIQMCLCDTYTSSVNLIGLPGISIPVGTDSSNLPIGAQIVAKAFDEKNMLRAANALEKELGTISCPYNA